MQTAWSLALHNLGDVKELTPEWFSDPAFLSNSLHLQLGKKQNGSQVGDVELPPWAKGSQHNLVYT